jgi:hypothetical protein
VPPRAPPRPSHPVTLACCRPCLSLTLSLSLKHMPYTHAAVAWLVPAAHPAISYAWAAFLPAAARPVPGPCTASSATSPDTVGQRRQPRRHRPPPGMARPPQASAWPALHTAARLPWPLLHPTLSTGQPPTLPASLSRSPAPRPPNSGRRLWMSPARSPPLDATSHLGPPPLDAIGRPPRYLIRYSSPLPLQMNVHQRYKLLMVLMRNNSENG